MSLLNKILNRGEFKKPLKFKEFEIKIYTKKDFNHLLALYERVFPGYMSKSLWNWKNINNPFGNHITIIIKHKKKVIASHSCAPQVFLINEKKYNCIQSMDVMTDKDYRGLGLSTYLGNITYEYAKAKGKAFVYGFPSDISKYLCGVKLKWDKVIKTSYFIKELNQKQNSLKHYNTFKIEKVEKVDGRINELWKSYNKKGIIIINKTRKYLNWRFKEHPIINYEIFYVKNKNNKIIAYFVLKRYKDKQDNKIGHIVDFLIKADNNISKLKIFKLIDVFATNKFYRKCKFLSFWIHDSLLHKYAKKQLGYKIIKKEPYFGYRIFNNNKQNLKLLNSMKNWYITMSNNDVF